MLSLVKVTVIGTLAEKPVIRAMEGHGKMVGLNVYTMRRSLDPETRQAGLEKEWNRIVITDQRLAAYAEDHLAKDDEIYLEGELHTDFWQDATYGRQSITYITLCQQGGKLRRVADEPKSKDPDVAIGMLAMARDARTVMAPSDDSLLECVA